MAPNRLNYYTAMTPTGLNIIKPNDFSKKGISYQMPVLSVYYLMYNATQAMHLLLEKKKLPKNN